MRRYLLLFILLTAGLAWAEPPAQNQVPNTSNWFVTEFFVNRGPKPGEVYSPRNSQTAQSFRYGEGYRSMYLVDVMPGQRYTLGFACQPAMQNIRVYLYDRWPYVAGARRVDLPMGPAVRTRSGLLEYRWRLGISPLSRATALYIIVESTTLKACYTDSFYLITPPISPATTLERGITYLEGPGDLMLAGEPGGFSYVIEQNATAQQAGTTVWKHLPITGDLIKNGDFAEGLNNWEPHRNYDTTQTIETFALQNDGLRLHSTQSQEREGLLQHLNANVEGASALILRADVRVDRQAQGGTGDGHQAPAAIAVCYEDAQGSGHCREHAFWQGFYSLVSQNAANAANGQHVPQGLWYRYQIDLMQLSPKPKIILYISLEGAGWPERDALIREVHLIKRAEKP